MKIKVAPHNMVNFLYENYLLFLEYANSRQVKLRFEKECDELEENAPKKRLPDAKMLIVEDTDSIRTLLASVFAPFYES